MLNWTCEAPPSSTDLHGKLPHLTMLGILWHRECPCALLAVEDGAPSALYTRGMYVFRVFLEIHENYLLWHLVQDVYCSLGASVTETLFTSQLFR